MPYPYTQAAARCTPATALQGSLRVGAADEGRAFFRRNLPLSLIRRNLLAFRAFAVLELCTALFAQNPCGRILQDALQLCVLLLRRRVGDLALRRRGYLPNASSRISLWLTGRSVPSCCCGRTQAPPTPTARSGSCRVKLFGREGADPVRRSAVAHRLNSIGQGFEDHVGIIKTLGLRRHFNGHLTANR